MVIFSQSKQIPGFLCHSLIDSLDHGSRTGRLWAWSCWQVSWNMKKAPPKGSNTEESGGNIQTDTCPMCIGLSCSDLYWCVCAHRVWFFVTTWVLAHETLLSVEFSKQEYWSGLPFPTPGDPWKIFKDPLDRKSNPGLQGHLHWQVDSLPLRHLGSPSKLTPRLESCLNWILLLSRYSLYFGHVISPFQVAFFANLAQEIHILRI